jgi:hypothetical protein
MLAGSGERHIRSEQAYGKTGAPEGVGESNFWFTVCLSINFFFFLHAKQIPLDAGRR